MKKELIVTLDSNILVSLLKGSKNLLPIYTAFLESKFLIVLSPEILKELASVLYRPKLNINPKDIKELFKIIREASVYVKPELKNLNVCRDPKDEFILRAALESKSDFIVTGDKDLLCLNPFKGLSIVTPAEFIKLLNE